jgi:DNA-binding IscR family transcriptional regulator
MNLTRDQFKLLSYLKHLNKHGHSGPLKSQWLSTAAKVSPHKLITVRDALRDMGLIDARRASHGYEYQVLA